MIYVVIQFGAILFLIVNAEFDALNTLSIACLLIAGVLGVRALVDMRPSNLNITPSLKEHHHLVTTGIYTYIRHPMYTSVILFCLGLLLSNNNGVAQLVMLVLIIDLWFKSAREEHLLTQRFPSYQNYQKRSGRFLPFL